MGPATVGEATRGVGVSKPAVTKHVAVLEQAGVVTRTVQGRTHRLALRERPLADASDWIERQRRLWSGSSTSSRITSPRRTEHDHHRADRACASSGPSPRTPERVFDAWTNPEVLRRWWAAAVDGRTPPWRRSTFASAAATACSMLDPGERHRSRSSASSSRSVRPEPLVYTWSWRAPRRQAGSRDTLVIVEFHADGDGTRVVVTHTGLPGRRSSPSTSTAGSPSSTTWSGAC